MDKLKVVIAGPGAGKTYNLKNEVLSCIPHLDRNRFCAVITYTNSATEELRQRISADVDISPNIFVGTIHSFLIRFIIEPFGHLVNMMPIEKNYIENVLLNYQPQNHFAEINAKQTKAKTLAKKGVLSYDTVVEHAKNILEGFPDIANCLGNRLQYIFIDEYQDSRVYIHQIFQRIHLTNLSTITIIGDPLQAVFRFTYTNSLIKGEAKSQPVSFIETPMKSYEAVFRNGIDEVLTDNCRSSSNIVSLTNRYISNKERQQRTVNGDNGIPVYFINRMMPSEIFSLYKLLKAQHNIDKIHVDNLKKSQKNFLKDFFLTKDWIDNENSTKSRLKGIYQVLNGETVRLEKGNHRLSSVLQEVSRCILAITGAKKQEFIKSADDEIEYRKFCFEIIRLLKSKTFNDYEHSLNSIRKQFRERFKIIGDRDLWSGVENTLTELSEKSSFLLSRIPDSCYSTIHSSKGLEATSVLAIAYSNHELDKWLDFQKANKDLDDDYRLGYVAFSRARDMLCIACLENISDKTREKLDSLGLIFY